MKRVHLSLALAAVGALLATPPALALGRPIPSVIDWAPVAGPTGDRDIKFHIRWQNPDASSPSGAFTGTIASQEFGVFLPDYGPIGQFSVPPLQPMSFFDVFVEVPLSSLPPAPQKKIPGQGGVAAQFGGGPRVNVACPPDTNWAGNVDIQWSGSNQTGQVNKHYADLLTCPGGAPSFIHFRPSNCPAGMPWTIGPLCPGWTMTLVNEDFTPAPNPVPAGWSGWISLSASGAVASGTNCCVSITFQCGTGSSTIDICSTACDCGQPVKPSLTQVDWTLSGTTVHFHQHWQNTDPNLPSDPVSGDMSSQSFGVFLPDYGPIGHFDVPPIAPMSFFDVFFDVDLSNLPPEPALQTPPGLTAGTPCFPQQWHGNVDINWTGPGGSGQVNKHFGEMPICAGGGPTYLFVEVNCASAVGATWNIVGLCPGFTATLVNPDHTPAPNPVPPGWIGQIAVTAAAGTPVGTLCCFTVEFVCDGTKGVIDVCAKTCQCATRKPVLKSTDWTQIGSAVRFHMVWSNPDGTGDSDPVSGVMHSQPFGAFAPDFGTIGQFDVPPIPPSSFFDVFMEVPLSSLPPEPPQQLPGGGPPPGSPCPPDTSWSGNVDINWAGPGGTGQTNRHFTQLLVRPGSGSSHIHTLIFCPNPSSWSITGLCPGWNATLLNEDFRPAPNPVPAGWTGWISVAAAAAVPSGTTCCFTATFVCDNQPGVIDVCAEACLWPTSDVPSNPAGVDFGIYSTIPNPTSGAMSIGFALPKSGHARLDVYTLGGQRVRGLFDGIARAGVNAVRWDGRGDNGRALAPGAYFVRLQAGERVSNKKIVLFH